MNPYDAQSQHLAWKERHFEEWRAREAVKAEAQAKAPAPPPPPVVLVNATGDADDKFNVPGDVVEYRYVILHPDWRRIRLDDIVHTCPVADFVLTYPVIAGAHVKTVTEFESRMAWLTDHHPTQRELCFAGRSADRLCECQPSHRKKPRDRFPVHEDHTIYPTGVRVLEGDQSLSGVAPALQEDCGKDIVKIAAAHGIVMPSVMVLEAAIPFYPDLSELDDTTALALCIVTVRSLSSFNTRPASPSAVDVIRWYKSLERSYDDLDWRAHAETIGKIDDQQQLAADAARQAPVRGVQAERAS